MSTQHIETTEPLEPLGVGARTIVKTIFPDYSLRSWRRLDSSGGCPRGFRVRGRKFWRMSDLRLWAVLGFPDRREFEARLRARTT